MTLYELTNDYMNLLTLAEDGELDPEMLKDTLEGLEGAIEDKADGYAKVIAQLNSDIAGLDGEIERLQNRKAAIKSNADNMKRTLQRCMIESGKTKFKTAFFSFGIQKNAPSLKVDVDLAAVPAAYRIPQPDKIDNAGIKKALKDGARFDWCHLEQTESLRIR